MRSALADFPPMDPYREFRALLDLRLDSIIEKARERRRAEAATARRASRVTPEIQAEIERRHRADEFQHDIAASMGLSITTVSRALRRIKYAEAGIPERAKFSEADVLRMRQMRREGTPLKVIAAEFRASRSTVCAALTGHSYSHLPGAIRMSASRATTSANAKLTAQQAEDIRRRAAEGERMCNLAREYSVTDSTIYYIVHPEKLRKNLKKRSA